MTKKINALSSYGQSKSFHQIRWLLFVVLWSLSLGIVFTGSSDTFFFKAAYIYLIVALVISVNKYFLYRRELRFLREFHHLSQTLDDIRILDSENPFKHILEAVVRIVGFDRAVLFLKDSDQEVIRAVQAYNLDESVREQLVVKKDDGPSIAWKVISTSQPVIVNDPSKHPEINPKFLELLKSNALAMAPISRGGVCWGLLVVDRHLSDNPITDDDLLQLQVLSDQISVSLQNYSLHEELSKKARLLEIRNVQIERELALAKIVQDGIFPRSVPEWEGLSLASCIRSARVIGGDFFRYLEGCSRGRKLCKEPICLNCENQIHGILIGDVCGKGIPAALVMAVVNCLFKEKVAYCSDPAVILSEVNISLKQYLGAETRFNSSAFLGFYMPREGKFVYANAGHDFPFFYSGRTKEIEELGSTGTLLGIFRESTFAKREIEMASGDRILFYTDGLVEFFEAHDDVEDGYEVLKNYFIENISLGSVSFINRIQAMIHESADDPLDDITAAMLEVRARQKIT